MPKTVGIPPALNLTAAKNLDGNHPISPGLPTAQSTESPMSPTRSAPGSPQFQASQSGLQYFSVNDGKQNNGPASPRITAMPAFPPSPVVGKHERDASKSFFSNFKASKSSHRLQSADGGISDMNDKAGGRSRTSSRDRSLYSNRRQESTPDLPRTNTNTAKSSNEGVNDVLANPSIPPGSSDNSFGNYKKGISKFSGILNRNKNGKVEEERRRRLPMNLSVETHSLQNGSTDGDNAPLKTAPLKSDYRERTFGSELGSSNRARSVDRHGTSDVTTNKKVTAPPVMASSLPKEGSSLLANIQQTGKGVGNRLGMAGKGLFNKMTRSASSNEREVPPEENYVCTTINLPLVQQTRKTRIAKRLELSRDKTEFWMPALPWRCIDYLNMNGCEEEGLYRIPGSGREVKTWQKRFDTEYDINLFEETELYDINTIGSMFKSWLRELPDEILPKAIQNKIAQECAGATTTPKMLKDELSKLPPFNYYLLFAITCHLSLLHSFAEKNKMDYRNLCICFQPCLKIDAFCFQFLVLNWKECFQGCWTENEFLQDEYRWEREGSTRSGTNESSVDERAISSSGSSQVVPHHQASKSVEAVLQRKASYPQMASHHKNTSSSTSHSAYKTHGTNGPLPSVPRIVQQTPEQKSVSDQQLPELANLSPIRM